MEFSMAIDEIMPDINDGSREPFIIYRDNGGGWHCDYTQNRYGEEFTWVDEAKAQDPLALTYKGADFSKASFPNVYNSVLCDRMRNEYNIARSSGRDSDDIHALVCFFNDNVGEFSHTLTDYLTTVERPLATLKEMCPFNLASDYDEKPYNEEMAWDMFDYIEKEIKDRLRTYPGESKSDKRIIEGYTEKLCIQLAGIETVLAEKPDAAAPYLVCNIKYDNPLGIEERYNGIVSDNYVEAMREFLNRVDTRAERLENERHGMGLPLHALTAAGCVPGGLDADMKGKVIIIKPEALAPEYRSASNQIKIVTGGFGASPNSRGNAVYCEDLYSGKQSRFERYDVLGVANIERLPTWAREKLVLREALKEPGVFEYGGYHFKPYRQFQKGEIDKHLDGDSRPWKQDAQYAMRNMRSDHELGLSKYDWQKADYSHQGFSAASGNSDADIFKCVENGKLYVPHENELFQYNEPPLKEKAVQKPAQPPKSKQPPSLLDEVREAAQLVEQRKAEHENAPVTKKRGGLEV